jgi:DNA-binding MarR family transcriptional regulator/N-acetylglutamate synthase-like GNAT family acetyltransferase
MREVEAVRRFNRFYTRRIGVLTDHYLGQEYTLPEARVLYELGHDGAATATALGRSLDLDLGYLSRLLQGLRRRRLVHAARSTTDARQSVLSLTAAGRKAYAALDESSRRAMGEMLRPLEKPHRARLVDALSTAEQVLQKTQNPIALRAHRPGDMGWVVERHGALYARECGWGGRFEALVADVVAEFLRKFDAKRERCSIAEAGGERVGSAFVVKKDSSTAQLRLLLIEPHVRGRGLGRRLVEECIAFARQRGYRKLMLWTHENLTAARAIYASAGFRLVRKEKHRSFGVPVVGEYWELEL